MGQKYEEREEVRLASIDNLGRVIESVIEDGGGAAVEMGELVDLFGAGWRASLEYNDWLFRFQFRMHLGRKLVTFTRRGEVSAYVWSDAGQNSIESNDAKH